MRVTVEGIVTSVEHRTREDKKFTELMLAQKGEKMQVQVRIPGHVADQYDLFQIVNVTGNLITWRTRDGVGMMVNVPEEE